MRLLPRSIALGLTTVEGDGHDSRAIWPVDRAFWLGRCQGFRVDDLDGRRVGVVEHVVYQSRIDCPDMVAVTGGMWRPRTREVPVDEVVEVVPSQSTLVVR